MNQPYRVRIKTKVKRRIAAIFFSSVLVLSIGLFYLLNTDFGMKELSVTYGNHFFLKPVSERRVNTKWEKSYVVGKFEIKPNKNIETHINITTSHNGFYCVAEILHNGKVERYLVVNHLKCV
jgi:hypothetical protein|tara:strand:- start:133 stop:498 length:366 start_codon:yes stop_codon:yes gene_type:complete